MSDSLWPPWTVTHQDPLSMGFPRQEYWSELAFPSPEDLPNPRIFPTLHYKQILFYWATREAPNYTLVKNKTKPYTLISIYLLNHLLLSPGLHLGNGLFCILPSFYYLTIHLPIHGNPPASSFQFPSILQGPQILHLPFTFLCVGQSAFELWTKCFLLFSYGTYI